MMWRCDKLPGEMPVRAWTGGSGMFIFQPGPCRAGRGPLVDFGQVEGFLNETVSPPAHDLFGLAVHGVSAGENHGQRLAFCIAKLGVV
jgi:hypothetical protein